MKCATAMAILVGLISARAARADDEIARGAIVSIQAQEIYVNLGAPQGIASGAAIRIKRAIHLHHPVTRAAIEDWIPIGSGTITEAGGQLSRAVIGELVSEVKVGDIVEILIDRPDRPSVTPTPTPPAPAPSEPADPETTAVLAVFVAQTGQPLAARIASWEQFVSTHPESRFAPAIRRDLEGLSALRDQMKPPPTSPTGEALLVAKVNHTPASSAAIGEPIPVVVVLDRADEVASGFLHYRTHGNPTYRRVLLARENAIYLRGTIPADVVAPPGVDYFVEISLPNGQSGLAVASAREPIAVAVAEPPPLDEFGPAPGRSSVKLGFEVLDFGTLDRRAGDHTDRMVTANVDFTYLIDKLVHSVGVGYGVYAGEGGFANRAWTPTNPIPKSGFQYGYADLELAGAPDGVHLGFGGQLIAGVGKSGFGLGGEGRFRIGAREGANLAFIARTIDQVGFLSQIRFGAQPFTNLLLGISVGATNQPNDGDVAAKLGTDFEWIGYQHVSIIVHTSWQGRNTAHGGLGGGAGLGFYW